MQEELSDTGTTWKTDSTSFCNLDKCIISSQIAGLANSEWGGVTPECSLSKESEFQDSLACRDTTQNNEGLIKV